MLLVHLGDECKIIVLEVCGTCLNNSIDMRVFRRTISALDFPCKFVEVHLLLQRLKVVERGVERIVGLSPAINPLLMPCTLLISIEFCRDLDAVDDDCPPGVEPCRVCADIVIPSWSGRWFHWCSMEVRARTR